MANQKKKRNHWVPQSYLRAFAADAGRKTIWRFSKEAGDPELKPIRNVAVSFYLYAPQGQQGHDYRFEEKLATLEQCFGTPFWAETTTGFIDLGNDTVRKTLSLLAAVMYLRNPLNLKMTKALHRTLVDQYSQLSELPDELEIAGRWHKVDKASWPAYRDANDDDIKRMWLRQVGSATWYAEHLMRMRWAVLLADEPVFVTSDNPVVVLHPSLQFKGLRDPETTVTFPLSPTRMLVMDNRHREPEGQYYPLKGNAGGVNVLLWRNAIEYLFSPRHPDDVCAEMCANAEEIDFGISK
ncbi:MAG: DUF4238 domain-containing protein [Methylocystis sp.]|nr:DUF4238 domain-containing protein [Methylocystis sp.]